MIQGQNQEVEGEQHQEALAFALQGQKERNNTGLINHNNRKKAPHLLTPPTLPECSCHTGTQARSG